MEKDQNLYKKLGKIAGDLPISCIHTFAELTQQVTKNTLVIHDEFDFWLLDKKHKVLNNARYILGFSASFFGDPKSTEAAFLKHQKVQIFDSKIDDKVGTTDYVEVTDPIQWACEDIFDGECGMLVYVDNLDDPIVKEVVDAADKIGDLDVWWNTNRNDVIGNVGKRIMFVDRAHYYLMRGYDYRSDLPIHLLITAPLPNQRAFQ